MNFFDFKESVTPKRESAAGPKDDANTLTVTQITRQIESALRAGMPERIDVKGETSNVNHHRASGHLYFTLKDSGACIDCVMFKSDASRLKFTPQDGHEFVASGTVKIYPQRGRYQLYVSSLRPLGQGALELAFRQLKEKLEREGLFNADRKRPLPKFPKRIALVTSRATAALQDILKVLRRFPWLRLAVYHVPVQGDGSAEKIAAAILQLNRSDRHDLILLARGGGSLEDLWEFNDERVARAVFASDIPVITGIGHEVDVSIADLVADYHAHTPTEAAQVATAGWRAAPEALRNLSERLRRVGVSQIQVARHRLASAERHEFFRRPIDRINAVRQLVDDRERSLLHAATERVRDRRDRLYGIETRLVSFHPRHQLAAARARLEQFNATLSREPKRLVERLDIKLAALDRNLRALDPSSVLKRGYSMTFLKKSHTLLRDPAQTKPGDRLLTRTANGDIESVVEDAKQPRLFEE